MFRRFLMLAILLAAAALAWGHAEAVAYPEIRHASVVLPGLPAGPAPIRALLISDIHVAGPDMPPERLAGIADTIAGLDPDVVLIAGAGLGTSLLPLRIGAPPEMWPIGLKGGARN